MKRLNFRGWDKELNKFVYASLESKGFIANDFLSVDEWQQYTGLSDKNDNEIYEGDIVKSLANCLTKDGVEIGEVFYKDGAFKIRNVDLFIVVDSFEPEIIGNIYENKELLYERDERGTN